MLEVEVTPNPKSKPWVHQLSGQRFIVHDGLHFDHKGRLFYLIVPKEDEQQPGPATEHFTILSSDVVIKDTFKMPQL